ncbi:FAD-dependent monooxygenase [Mycobacterium montefiorense]|uniref:FAD-dependent monooxygenase n=1 Tax=Mycobacterium montefiorense TaxID=154654 RepID=UPI0021DD5B10|nr:FAD-dependent monooxygenase [Mycobacterium montefiorense]MCV7426908.1 FAD-dependent monooxygenase [Mycobacterium montefiorense]GLE51745.1 hypothetical protein ATCCBAA256_13230 [Mycobacterium montefiorense]
MSDDDTFLIVGAGPAGMLLAGLLGSAGFRVVVLEKAKGFSRTFRGESISPDSVRILAKLGVLDYVPEDRIRSVRGTTITDGGSRVLTVDFERLLPGLELPAEIPQDSLLAAMQASAEQYGTVDVRFGAKVVGLERASGRVCGVRYHSGGQEHTLASRLVIGADGRYSAMRDLAGFSYEKQVLARDFLWMKVSAPNSWDSDRYHVRITRSDHLVCIPTVPDMVRLGVNIPKGGLRDVRDRGFASFIDRIASAVPELEEVLRTEVTGWKDTSMLDIFTTVSAEWTQPGLVLIGDAAHAITPILAQGVNNAVVDALVLADQVRLVDTDSKAELDAATRRFADLRRPDVTASRAVQLRQERLFELSGMGALLRRLLYRVVDLVPPLQRRIWRPVYYGLQDPSNPASKALERCRKRASSTADEPS